MTNGERIQSIFPNISSRLDAETGIIVTKWADNTTKCFKASWWNAEYKEPTTKNETKYCDRNICLKNEYNNVGCEDCEVTNSQEPTTKNDSSELEKNSQKLEKDFGESDCISRQAVLELIADYDLSMGQVVRGIHALPSVTPQTRKGHWIECMPGGAEEWCYKCSECNFWKYKKTINLSKFKFCPNCGADMRGEE